MTFIPIHFIQAEISVYFENQPLLEKKTGCPDGFSWNGVDFKIDEIINEWHEYQRKGRMARNMQPQHALAASKRGSWGVGLDYYRVRTDSGRYFDLYYDRAPVDSDNRKGAWFLERELSLS